MSDSHSITQVEADERPDLSADLDNPAVLYMVQQIDDELDLALANTLLLIGTQVSRDKQITKLGGEALKIRAALIKAQARLSEILGE